VCGVCGWVCTLHRFARKGLEFRTMGVLSMRYVVGPKTRRPQDGGGGGEYPSTVLRVELSMVIGFLD